MCNVPSLSEYFLQSKWLDEINKENPLGMQGNIARTFANLVQAYWTGSMLTNVVREFKVHSTYFWIPRSSMLLISLTFTCM